MLPAYPSSLPIPADLRQDLTYPLTPWNLNFELFNRIRSQPNEFSGMRYKTCDVLNTDPEYRFILRYFMHNKPRRYSIKRVVCIHNPDMTRAFEAKLVTMDNEALNERPNWPNEPFSRERGNVIQRWKPMANQFSPLEIKTPTSTGNRAERLERARVLPGWHGIKKEVIRLICADGLKSDGKHHYSNPEASPGSSSTTDVGYFGDGIYFTNSAGYAAQYSEGYLMLAWVSMREPYPVISDIPIPRRKEDILDIRVLKGRKTFQNYNAHFIPVRPKAPGSIEYYPCHETQIPECDEWVVIDKTQALPRFWIELGLDLPTVTLSAPTTTSELLMLILTLFDQEKVKNCQLLWDVLETILERLLELPGAISLSAEEVKLFNLGKQLLSRAYAPRERTPNNPLGNILNLAFRVLLNAENEYQQGCLFAKSGDLKQAFLNYQKAAEKGHVEAQYQLARCHATGKGTSQDKRKAYEWYRKAAAQGHLVAQGDCYYFGYGRLQDFLEALKQDEVLHSFLIEALKSRWCGWDITHPITKNFIKACRVYEYAAEQGNAEAQYRLGLHYCEGPEIAINFNKAIELLQRAAEQGHLEAQYRLGLQYYNRDDNKYREWLEKAAMQGHANSQYNLGCHYASYQREMTQKEAVKWYQRAAEQGHSEAQYCIGLCYYYGQGVTQDYKEAVKWLERAAEQGHGDSQHKLGLCYINSQGVTLDLRKAREWLHKAVEKGVCSLETFKDLIPGEEEYQEGCMCEKSGNLYLNQAFLNYKKAAEKGHTEAHYQLALCYDREKGTSKDERKAQEWYQKCAAQGHPVAQGDCYYFGYGVLQNYKEAAKYYLQAANQGNAEAQRKIGVCYYNGKGVTQDFKEAVKWFHKADEKCIPLAQYNLGICYKNGQGVARDLGEARRWFQKATFYGNALAREALKDLTIGEEEYKEGLRFEDSGDLIQAFLSYQNGATKGYDEAQYKLAICYKTGKGIYKDTKKSEEWYQKAADQNHLMARGICYYFGYGTPQDFIEAVKWFERAAEQGYDDAQYMLGECYSNGQGVAEDPEEGKNWYLKAAKQGHADAQYRLGFYYNRYTNDGYYRYENGYGYGSQEGAMWFQQAADKGHAGAQYRLAMFYKYHKELRNTFRSYELLQKAAEQGHVSAQHELGLCYYHGKGVAKDLRLAAKWFQKAAEQECLGAQYNLGVCYKKGEGVIQDLREARKWFEKAAKGNLFAQEELKKL